jgi:Lon protease-like protein
MEIGLFPLGMVLLPGEQMPLHIFEPRYRELIGECLDLGVPFGLVLADDEQRREIGTTALVTEVLERLPDGRLNVVVEGQERFRIVEETSGRSFLTAEVETVPDEAPEPGDEERERCLEAFRALAREAESDADDPVPPREDLSYWIAMRVEFGVEVKQALLEERSPRTRVTRLTDLLGRARTTLAWAKTARERAATNGRVEPPG